MGDLVSRLKSEGPQIWRQLSTFQKATLLAVAIAAVGAIAFLTQWSQQPEYAAAFTGLTDTDASAIVAKLKELKIPYEIADRGATVRVPSDKVDEARLQLASQGLPKGGTVGFELFDKMNFGMTDFAQRLNYQRALEGELARTIGRISGVEDARVHIVIPQDELFAAKEKPTTASVVLRLKSGLGPDARQVQGISVLVARSVEGLKPENVTIVDGDGKLLSGGDGLTSFAGGLTSTQLDAQRNVELSLQRDIQGMLEQVLGPHKAVVRVNADLDWDQYEKNSETYSPSGTSNQVRSSKEVSERSSVPPGDLGGGIPTYPLGAPAGPVSRGTATPVPTAEAGAPAITTGPSTTGSQSGYERKEATNNYEISKLVERVVKTPGAIRKQSVSVLLDGPLDDATVASVTKAVGAAAGIDAARGDSIIVTSLPFDRAAQVADQQAQKDSEQRGLYFEIGKYVLAALSLLVVLLLTRSIASRLSPPRHPKITTVGGGAQALAAGNPRLALPAEDSRPLLVQSEVTELAKTQPKLVAGIIKTWLDEREAK